MPSRISLQEAAQMLGVSKETLRNWDKAGKLRPKRNPKNNYRTYALDDVLRIKEESSEEYSAPAADSGSNKRSSSAVLTEDLFKRHLARLHRSLRDAHGDSSLVARFDEITKLLFAKALSETNQEHRDLFTQLLEDDAAFAKRVRSFYETEAQKHSTLVPPRFRKLNLPDEAIVAAATDLSALQLTGASVDVKGVAYEEIVRNTFDKGDNQQFFTPREIAGFLVAMLADETRGAVCDPASGTGGFLVEMLRHNANADTFTALEVDERLAWVTGINLFLSGAKKFDSCYLGNGGSLGVRGKDYLGKFDVIITNPPFGSDYSDVASLATYELGRGFSSRRRGILFLERCIDMLKPDGILGLIIDEGVLSLTSTQDVRKFLQRRTNLLAVVSLPETAFMPYASVNSSILILQKKKNGTSGLTFFARSERVGRKPNGEPDTNYDANGNPVPNSDLPEILSAWREFRTQGKTFADPERVFIADPYAEGAENSELRLDFRYHHPARLTASAAIRQSKYPVVSLGEICAERRETYVPSVDLPEQFIYYTGLAQMEPRTGNASQVYVPTQSLKSSVKKFERHDILFARMRPNLRKCHFVEFAHDGYTSSECFVLTVRRDSEGAILFDPFVLSVLLRSDLVYGQIMHQVAGIGRPRLASKDFKHILIPLPPPHIQLAMKESFLKSRELHKKLEAEAAELLHQAEAIKVQSVENVARSLCGIPVAYRAA
jgi:type I restriction enzyme M protein